MKSARSSSTRAAPPTQILVVGDTGVGKSCLISSFLRKKVVLTPVKHMLDPVFIGAEFSSDGVPMHIVDTDAESPQTEALLRANEMDVILVVCTSSPDSLSRVQSRWLHKLQQLRLNKPVVVAVNMFQSPSVLHKAAGGNGGGSPAGAGSDATTQQDKLIEQLRTSRRVDTCLTFNVENLDCIPDVFENAQQAYLYPLAPLFDSSERRLKPNYLRALKRMFRECDEDCDGVLSLDEVNYFQSRIGANALGSISEFAANIPSQGSVVGGDRDTPAVVNECLTLDGFVRFHQALVDSNRQRSNWLILGRFDFDRQLRASWSCPELPDGESATYELTTHAFQYLRNLFYHFDIDCDGSLNAAELDELFEVSHEHRLVAADLDQVNKDQHGGVTLTGWLSCWCLVTHLDPLRTVRMLYALGYRFEGGSAARALKTVVSRSGFGSTAKPVSERRVLHGAIFGSPRCGKSTFISSLTAQSPGAAEEVADAVNAAGPTTTLRHTAASIMDDESPDDTGTPMGPDSFDDDELEGDEEGPYLVLTEVPSDAHEVSRMVRSGLSKVDIVVLMFDVSNSQSLAYVIDLLETQLPATLPVVFVAGKSDLHSVQQTDPRRNSAPIDVFALCRALELPNPDMFRPGFNLEIFRKVFIAAMNAEEFLPNTPERQRARRRQQMGRYLKRIVTLSILTAGAYFGYRVWGKRPARRGRRG